MILLAILGLYGLWNAFVIGDYFHNASLFMSGLVLLLAALGYYLAYKLVVWIVKLKSFENIFTVILLSGIAVGAQSCDYAKSNQQVLVSENYGMDWKQISTGESVPKGNLQPGYMKVVIPNYPMQGQCKFIANMKDKVKIVVLIDYDYSITSGINFIKQAKYLGKANQNADSEDALNSSVFETAENMVIDTRIREVSKGIFVIQDVTEFSQQDLEEELHNASNKILEEIGITLNFVTLTFLMDENVQTAIDVASAMRIYRAANLEEMGKKIIVAKAGSARINNYANKEEEK